ncbi:hydroxyisourate hydrolase [Sporolactobacillus vineae]|uniref:hydroxyisourate hydrolase n=1 Tax=Sporolactobacillus vineae TaxID=444463 RepID=UPI00028A386C|nr:hydroxyisourate hydrolase [Sporolactobacillus vineae]
MGALTTHILDLVNGRPAADVRVDLYEVNDARATFVCSRTTNKDGRMSEPLIHAGKLHSGTYELRFHIGDYFRESVSVKGAHPFLDIIPVRFNVASPLEDYHVPLLVSPYGYQVYRGS